MKTRVRLRKFLPITERRRAMRQIAKMEADLTRVEEKLQAEEDELGGDAEGEDELVVVSQILAAA